VLGLPQTGTGKTAAFVLPILQRLLNGSRGRLRVLIISPTRELAEQTHTVIGKVLVFTRTKHRAKKLARQLIKVGLSASSLQGNLSQNRRQEAMENFRSGRVKVLVATDIAARGIDVSRISHVIKYDMPDMAIAYTHRIRRTVAWRSWIPLFL